MSSSSAALTQWQTQAGPNLQNLLPGCGIDIEPDPGDGAEDIDIEACTLRGNHGAGLQVYERGRRIDVPRGGKMDWSVVREKIAKHGMRNSNVLAIAPTATISNIVGVDASIEPSFGNLSVKSNLSGEFTVINQYLVRDL